MAQTRPLWVWGTHVIKEEIAQVTQFERALVGPGNVPVDLTAQFPQACPEALPPTSPALILGSIASHSE